ncbi:ribonuclease T [Hwanghaeella grinnelliae]|uniref:Ribonuclease T n=1 Tax=Hwanghaeella grinnelliae TaxID=2500179 RepID=A0A437QJL0_9PROT|nr:ribonuclease T [Hwanghaeella grinnelliae]RVU34697.1 ribonuclease T [Hwanghaeella grinnelliae]
MFTSPINVSVNAVRVAVTAMSAFIAVAVTVVGASAQAQKSENNLLALTWQPAFCEYRAGKPECVRLNAGQLPVAARRLSLHGLWPQPRGNDYCGVPQKVLYHDKKGRWSSLPEPPVDEHTRGRLAVVMPGVESHLHRHEWVKHGTCYQVPDQGGAETAAPSDAADVYFDDALSLTDAINNSPVVDFLAGHIGKSVDAWDIRARFDEAFGDDAGARVAFVCKADGLRTLFREIRIGLRGAVAPDRPVGDLIRAADPVPIGCRRGIVDPAGLQ